jgi:hypothetical protein
MNAIVRKAITWGAPIAAGYAWKRMRGRRRGRSGQGQGQGG